LSPESDTIQVLLEHKDFIIVNKPIGVPMHDPDIGITHQVREQLGDKHFYLVHRLDTPTSGCLILATNKEAAAQLNSLFECRQISKYYLALIDAKPKKKQGTISGDMINRRSGQRALLRTKENPVFKFFTGTWLTARFG
jgi:tRNA pseudouridine32 synthase/23S rRNA pseudouridine746 synthase